MGTRVRVASFNVQNLFNRYALLDQPWQGRDYDTLVQAVGLASLSGRDGGLVSYETTHMQRNNTAEVILEAEPDVLVLCEVENIYSLRIFNHDYLSDHFDQIVLVDGNDPRGIDVGVMVRKGFKGRIEALRTHVDETKPGAKGSVVWGSRPNFGYMAHNALFSRDCLEVDLKIGAQRLTLLANHFKAQDGTAASDQRRAQQAARVAELFAQARKNGLTVVLGDLNADVDAVDKKGQPTASAQSLRELARSPGVVDAFAGVPDAWTHFYEHDREVSRLDYLLLDERLRFDNPQILRKGLSKLCKQYAGERYPTVSFKHTEASDHCLVSVDLSV